MAKVCSETLKLYKEIFDEAYLMGRNSGSQGIFIAPEVAFESFLKEKLEQASETHIEVAPELQLETITSRDPQALIH